MLYVVGTPIGNLKDISLRALEVLNSVDEIACEDTRHSLTLLNHHGIKKPLVAYHKFNEKESSQKLIDKLKQGLNIALISDAGMPVISDPGQVLINMLLEEGQPFTVVPGACAFVSALVLSGMDSSRFAFMGFLPQKSSERKELLNRYSSLDLTQIFYSAPHDIAKDVRDICNAYGNRRAVAVKEITKVHERVEPFNLADGLPTEPKGEYVLIVQKAERQIPYADLTDKELIDKYIAGGMDKKQALKQVAKERGVSKSELYKYTIN